MRVVTLGGREAAVCGPRRRMIVSRHQVVSRSVAVVRTSSVISSVISVNVGRAIDAEWAGRLKRTAIDKRPAAGRVAVRTLGLAGDEQADLDHHGGVDKAVYAYAREDLDWWAGLLGRELRDGAFGENLTTRGLEVSGARLGEVWRVGSATLRVCGPRMPCAVFRNWLAERGWVRRFTQAGRPGAYLSVAEHGTVAAGDTIEVLERPDTHPTLAESVAAASGDIDVLRRVMAVPGLGPSWQAYARRYLVPASS